MIFSNIMYIIGGFDGQRLNDMHHVGLPIGENTQSINRRRPSQRPFSSTSGFIPSSSNSELGEKSQSQQSSAESEMEENLNQGQKNQMQKKIKRLQ